MGVSFSDETEAKYKFLMGSAERLYDATQEKLKSMTNIVLLWQSFLTRSGHIVEWADKLSSVPLKRLSESEEYDQESVVIKLIRFGELEKRAYEKQRVRDRIEKEAVALMEATGNATIADRLEFVNRTWLALRDTIRSERLRLENVCKMWREFENLYQNLSQSICSCRISAQEDNRTFKSLDMLGQELAVSEVSNLSKVSSPFVLYLLAASEVLHTGIQIERNFVDIAQRLSCILL